MKNLLLIIHKLSNGGAERAITLLANTLKNDYNVTMVVFDNKIKEYIPEVKVIDLHSSNNTKALKKIKEFIYRIKEVKKIKKELNIDCSISYLPGPNLVNCLSKSKDKVIISIRNMQSKLNLSIEKRLSNQISLLSADKIVAVSKMVEDDIKCSYKVDSNKITTIANMIDFKMIEDKMAEEIDDFNFNKDDFTVINIGRLIPQKGQWHLIKAFKIVTQKYHSAKLLILGRGELKEDLENLIKKLNLEENVILMDFKVNPYKYLASSDLLVSTSLYEGMPNVILEAMACSLPIIATDCEGGTKEILNPNVQNTNFVRKIEEAQYGILIPKLDEQFDETDNISKEEHELADIIIEFINNKEKRNLYVQKSKDRIKDFENKVLKNDWINLIEQ